MSVSTAAAGGRYTLRYRVRNQDLSEAEAVRTFEVHATPQEIETLVRDGYLVREGLLETSHLESLRCALQEVADREAEEVGVSTSRRFGGLFLRHLMDKHPAFLDLLRYQPTLSVARAVFGPYVQVRGLSARISFPGEPNQETHWHYHQRLIPEPLPPFFMRPQTLDCLIYLDETSDANGPLCVMPGSHQWIEQDLPADDYSDRPGAVTLRLPAGSVVLCHGALWHRALPTRPDGNIRRLLLLGYGPCWGSAPSTETSQNED